MAQPVALAATPKASKIAAPRAIRELARAVAGIADGERFDLAMERIMDRKHGHFDPRHHPMEASR
jgi:hypothetical protein